MISFYAAARSSWSRVERNRSTELPAISEVHLAAVVDVFLGTVRAWRKVIINLC